ncbi:MAG: hypothetical protein JWN95_3498 [Frankiales bacterium]|nr:hypothetical protein [Frankiales bacterium]
MTGFQLTRPKSATTAGWAKPTKSADVADRPNRVGRHASMTRARLTVRRMLYVARHARF